MVHGGTTDLLAGKEGDDLTHEMADIHLVASMEVCLFLCEQGAICPVCCGCHVPNGERRPRIAL